MKTHASRRHRPLTVLFKDWEDIWSGWMGAEGVHQCNDGDMGQKVMFYRVAVP